MSEERISRRRILKRIGGGAVIAWSAPVLTSIRAPAYAESRTAWDGVQQAVRQGLEATINQLFAGGPGQAEFDRMLDDVVCIGVRSDEGPRAIVERADLVVDGTQGFAQVLEVLAGSPAG